MTRGKRIHAPEIEVHLLREGIVESTHRAVATVCDRRGRLLAQAGPAEMSTFIRSALKPFQAMTVMGTGVLERFDLNDKDLAIICSSHQGTTAQARQVFRILWRCDLEPSQLQCPIPDGKQTPLQHNCSGKHAGMLAACKQRHWPLNTYLKRSHPLQKLIVDKVGELLGMPGDEFIRAVDDCGAPTYSMQLGQMATLYAHLASGDRLDLERITRAMVYHPALISGEGGFDTELMRLSEGEIVSKSGAEGIQCIGRVGEGMGLAIKVLDGSKRAKYAVAIQLLKQVGWISPEVAESLAEKFMDLSEYKRLEVVGEMTML
ncbi:MAG: asparaginase [Jaaginema sp. PMC 1079.18]|nr:asparaginase [Jaaginema sp. PMC 1080.18]MEC4851177.1 asparaginase [Jaaginema sp. PMC 1079.18]MEC4866120.1 asparaginase [Jaaginema sp. PMC 1078.18]